MDVENDSTFTSALNPNAGVPKNYGRFYRKWIRNNYQSAAEGREIGEYVDYVMIVSPGQMKSEVHRKATPADKAQFREEWAAYEAGREQVSSGTPIELLPGMDASRAAPFKLHYVLTIEQLADLSDLAAQKTGSGSLEWRERAKKYLDSRGADKRALETAHDRIAELERQLGEVQAQLAQVLAPPKTGKKVNKRG